MNWKFKRGRVVLVPDGLQTECLFEIKFKKRGYGKHTLALPSLFLYPNLSIVYILFLLFNVYFAFN